MARFLFRLLIVVLFLSTCFILLFLMLANLGINLMYGKIERYYYDVTAKFFILIFLLTIKNLTLFHFTSLFSKLQLKFVFTFIILEFLFLGLMSIYLLVFPSVPDKFDTPPMEFKVLSL